VKPAINVARAFAVERIARSGIVRFRLLSGVAQIDYGRTGGSLPADGLDPISRNNDDARLNHSVAASVEQSSSPQNIRILSIDGGTKQEARKNSDSHAHEC
jgi:hypothetical protein